MSTRRCRPLSEEEGGGGRRGCWTGIAAGGRESGRAHTVWFRHCCGKQTVRRANTDRCSVQRRFAEPRHQQFEDDDPGRRFALSRRRTERTRPPSSLAPGCQLSYSSAPALGDETDGKVLDRDLDGQGAARGRGGRGGVWVVEGRPDAQMGCCREDVSRRWWTERERRVMRQGMGVGREQADAMV